MNQNIKEIEINGVVYIPKSESQAIAPSTDGMRLVIIRAAQSGVHYGFMKSQDKDQVTLVNSRRVWYWAGAASLSELALSGSAKPKECKISVVLPEITVLGVIEIIPVCSQSQKSIDSIKPWKNES